MAGTAALAMSGITKSFPGVRALDDVRFDCHGGEVHAICGENGAGKSTLMKILGGIYRPDSGTMAIDGRPVTFDHPVQARRAGIGIVHQEFSLLPHRSVADNICLGLEPARHGVVDRAALRARARALLERAGASLPLERPAASLSVAQLQVVEIAKALALDPRILVLDEPTAALDEAEARRLLALVRRLRGEGVAVVYISHRMAEIAGVADRVTVLKDGRNVATAAAAEMPAARIVRLMVGRPLTDLFPPRGPAPGAVLLDIAGGGNAVLAGIDLVVRHGEIVGVAGLEGSGKSDLARAVCGDAPFTRGTMRLDGAVLRPTAARAAIARGIGLLPDDRKRDGLALGQPVRDNATLVLRAFAGALRPPRAGAMADRAVDARLRALDVRAGNFGQPVRLLSGGNQQKVIVGRWLARDPALLVFAEPTRGIDVAAKAAIYAMMRDLATRGRGILLVSSDLPEIVGVSDRIVVMRDGRIAGECPAGAGEEAVMALAVGHAEAAAA
jgi:ribose transport system ATP-binding protein